jgi:hypothetical protein
MVILSIKSPHEISTLGILKVLRFERLRAYGVSAE